MNSTLTDKRQKLWAKLRDPDYRNAFVSSTIASRLAIRIYNLRKKYNWNQTKLAQEAGMKQGRISVLEQADYENFTFSTLKKIAAAFNVALIVDFVSFPDFLSWANNFDSKSVIPQTFEASEQAVQNQRHVASLNQLVQVLSGPSERSTAKFKPDQLLGLNAVRLNEQQRNRLLN